MHYASRMVNLPARLEPYVKRLLAAHAGAITLDAIGDALGTAAVSAEEIDRIITALERAGRTVVGPHGPHGEANLKAVLPAARALAASLGRKPTVQEIAGHLGLPEDAVRHALALGSVIGR